MSSNTLKMKQSYMNFIIILGFLLMHKGSCQAPPMNPPATQTVTATTPGALPPGGGPGPVCDDSAIAALYAMIPDIIQGCMMIQNQISQGFQFTPNGQSQMAVILQNVQWQNMLVTCDMIIKTKQMADQIKGASGSAQSSASGSASTPPNASGALPTTAGAPGPGISTSVSLSSGPTSP